MWCNVTLPHSVLIEVKVDPKAIAQEVLQKVCENLGIANESDYFGLKYTWGKNKDLWVNLRNPLASEGTSHGPHRLAMKVKFWVPPHLLLQETTRHYFYIQARVELSEGRLPVDDWNLAAKLLALIVQAESGDYDPIKMKHCNNYGQYGKNFCTTDGSQRPADFLQKVFHEHRECQGMKSTTAEYWLLKSISNLENFGEEMFHGKRGSISNVTIGVGPHGISIKEPETEKQIIPYTAIKTASSHRRTLRLEYFTENANENEANLLEIKQETCHAASGLYRAITEKHAFYSCETVRSAVTDQYIRDFKGTIVSIFNEDSTLGKKYVFDIRRTCREVYDNARRALYTNAASEGLSTCIDVEGLNEQLYHNCHDSECKESQEKYAKLLDAMTCRICMDHAIDMVFLPCAHVVACSTCADRCDRCPLCRADIAHKQVIYLPTEFTQQQQQTINSLS